ncbi:hypothetical protein B6U98_05505 [Thermoplasmatales archaeon ex4572_165]|nr:MAG: hypothetical protein B6U98_05505 [Thermoplasmatales archaeon ex4572_165]
MKKYIALILCFSIISIGFLSGCVSDDNEIKIIQFDYDSDVVNSGDKVMLFWTVTGATSVSLDQGIGNVSLVGDITLVLNETTEFTLTAKNTNKTVSDTIIVYVKNTSYSDSIIIDDDSFEQAKRDMFEFNNVILYKDSLEITVSYSGGCEDHVFELISKEAFMESDPVQIDLVLSHDANDDLCEAYITETLVFNISKLKQKWQNEYGQDAGIIILLLEDYPEEIRYIFGAGFFSFLNVTIQTDHDVYGINGTIQVKIYLENLKDNNVTLNFSSSKVADFHCKNNSDEVVYRWSNERGFDDAITPVIIPAKSKIELFNFSWYRISNAEELLENGVYTLQGWIPGFYYVDENIDYSSSPGPSIYSDTIEITFV